MIFKEFRDRFAEVIGLGSNDADEMGAGNTIDRVAEPRAAAQDCQPGSPQRVRRRLTQDHRTVENEPGFLGAVDQTERTRI
jgi:hypothetical protein